MDCLPSFVRRARFHPKRQVLFAFLKSLGVPLALSMATPEATPRAAAARWREAALSPWSPPEQGASPSLASPSLDGYVPFGAEPAPRRALRPLNGRTNDASGPRKRTPQGRGSQLAPSKDTPSAALPHCSPEQNSRFAALRQSAAQSFDPEVHESMLRELWQRGKLGDDFARVSPCWRTLGFRQDDPGLDLQGCGALGLRQLVHFCARGGAEAALAPDNFPVSPFPLATASLNVTLSLCCHLRLLPAASSSQPPCMDPTLRHFLRLSAELEPACALDLMHAECLRGRRLEEGHHL